MRIENLRVERRNDWRRVVARLQWEDTDRPDQELYVETTEEFAEVVEPSPDALLVAALPLAVWHGERRIQVEGSVCPRLRDGLAAVMATFAMWYDHCRPLAIEPTQGFTPALPRPGAHTAAFMSGGVDALALLRANRLDYPLDHPGSIRSCLLLFGLNSHDFAGSQPRSERLTAFEVHRQRLQQLAERAHFTLVPLQTNVRTLYDSFQSWADVGFGAGIHWTALAMPQRVRSIWLASEGTGVDQPPRGTHPLLNHHFSTTRVEVLLGQPALSRLEKTRIVADWEDARPLLRSCFYQELPAGGAINCERCEKCIRTMLALLALGRLEQVSAFASDDVTLAMLEAVQVRTAYDVAFHAELIEPLEQRGRHDLARLLRRKLRAYHRRERWRWLQRLTKR